MIAILQCGCKRDNFVPDGLSIGTSLEHSNLRLAYLLSHIIGSQSGQYLHVSRSHPNAGDYVYELIEPDLQLNILRGIYLLSTVNSDSREAYQLSHALEKCRKAFTIRPTKLFYTKNKLKYDFGHQEPVLPRYYDAHEKFVNFFGKDLIR